MDKPYPSKKKQPKLSMLAVNSILCKMGHHEGRKIKEDKTGTLVQCAFCGYIGNQINKRM